MIPREWIFSHRCSWITVYVFCHNAQSEPHSDPRDICTLSLLYQLPNCNCLPSMLLFILWRDATSELWTPVQFPLHCFTILLLLALFTLLAYYYPFTTRYAPSFVHSKPVRLTTSSKLGAKFLVVLCAGFTLLLAKSYTPTSSYLAPLSGVSQS
jgi:hypothetical protein